MAFTASINSINLQNDQWTVTVLFGDSATGWSSSKTYTFPSATTQTQAMAAITVDGTAYKASLAQLSALQGKVGTVITI